ncbi:MAG: CHAP domain-containing protein [Acidimicrobiales bacterium]
MTPPATASPAAAPSEVLCQGYSACTDVGYPSHGYGDAEWNSYWGMDAGDECTNYVAYVESVVYGVRSPDYVLGNAVDWPQAAAADGVLVNRTPSVGSVAEWGAYDPGVGPDGHVAIVEAVGPGDSWIEVSQQHFDEYADGYIWTKIFAGSQAWQSWPDAFIHFTGTRVGDDGPRVAGRRLADHAEQSLLVSATKYVEYVTRLVSAGSDPLVRLGPSGYEAEDPIAIRIPCPLGRRPSPQGSSRRLGNTAEAAAPSSLAIL